MNKIKSFISSRVGIAVSFTLAVALLLFGSVGGARAALTYYSDTYQSQVQMHDIGVSLVENGNIVSRRDYFYEVADGTWDEHKGVLLANMLSESNGMLRFGQAYKEELAVQNSGNIDTYVRVSIYKYWVDDEGKKVRSMDPALIDLNLVNLVGDNVADADCWIHDEESDTPERTVLYYNQVLPCQNEDGKAITTPIFSDTITIDGNIIEHVKVVEREENGVKYIDKYYDYNGYRFVLEATVDSVQDHNAKAAIKSAWGKTVTIGDDKSLSLNN